MTCPACTVARANPNTGLQQVGCHGCWIRSLAQGPLHLFYALRDALPEEERAAFQAEVVTEYRRIKAARSPKP
jgi:hypothetical protein